MLEILVNNDTATRISGAVFFKHKYITNPTVTPKERVIVAAGALAQALDNQIPPHMQAPTIQALSDLQQIFQQSATRYNMDPTMHVIPNDPPRVPVDTNPSITFPGHTSKGEPTTNVSPTIAHLLHTPQCLCSKGGAPGHSDKTELW